MPFPPRVSLASFSLPISSFYLHLFLSRHLFSHFPFTSRLPTLPFSPPCPLPFPLPISSMFQYLFEFPFLLSCRISHLMIPCYSSSCSSSPFSFGLLITLAVFSDPIRRPKPTIFCFCPGLKAPQQIVVSSFPSPYPTSPPSFSLPSHTPFLFLDSSSSCMSPSSSSWITTLNAILWGRFDLFVYYASSPFSYQQETQPLALINWAAL